MRTLKLSIVCAAAVMCAFTPATALASETAVAGTGVTASSVLAPVLDGACALVPLEVFPCSAGGEWDTD